MCLLVDSVICRCDIGCIKRGKAYMYVWGPDYYATPLFLLMYIQ